MQVWMMSNRQPWTEAVISGIISSKTRDNLWIKTGDLVFLHASLSLWSGWDRLSWTKGMDVKSLPRGVVYGLAHVMQVGDTRLIMPKADRVNFVVRDFGTERFCGMSMTVLFDHVVKLPQITVRGLQQPSKKLPKELLDGIGVNVEYQQALYGMGVNWADLVRING